MKLSYLSSAFEWVFFCGEHISDHFYFDNKVDCLFERTDSDAQKG